VAEPTAKEQLDPQAQLDRLAGLAQDVLARCRARGASQADVVLDLDRGLAVNVRLGEVETVEYTRDRGLSLTVYFGQRKGSASTADLAPASLEATVEQACAIAKLTEEDPAAGLAEAELMATEFPDFDQWHPWGLDAEHAIALAVACEQAGREADPRIDNSEGAAVNTNESLSVYANTHGFVGRERSTSHSLSCSLIAGKGSAMQRDYWYTSALAAEDLEPAAAVGRRAAERAVARLSPRQVKTGEYPVLYAPEVARSLIGHLLGAVSGGALYRRASFLLDQAGQRIFPAWMNIVEKPHLRRGFRSAAFDGEGVATREQDLVRDGVLVRYVLGSYSARKLGLKTTGNAGGIHNLVVETGEYGFDELVQRMGRGLVVTELMGQGVNTVTGDYSRGAAGFWVENGEIVHPVDELTIAGNLRDMFQRIEAVGRDVDRRSHILTGSILVGRMTVAGAA
jgi:PmbA protein